MYSMLIPSFLLLLAFGLSNCDEYICPEPTDVYPCSCNSSSLGLSVNCNGLKKNISVENLQKALTNLSGKKIKDIRFVLINMELVPAELLNGLVMQEVYLSLTNITEFPAFTGSENTLQKLDVYNAIHWKYIQNFTLKVSHLKKLKSFNFDSNHNIYIKDKKWIYETISIGNDWFENAPSSLKTVKLYGNEIKSFGDRFVSGILNLKEIDLGLNRIEEVHRSMFPNPAKRLLSIDLRHNYIKSLPQDIFTHMPVLEKVDVSRNLIRVLDERTWKPVWEQLDSLTISHREDDSFVCDQEMLWTFGVSRPRRLTAICNSDKSDEEYKRRRLSDIIDEKQGLSSNTN